VERVNDVEDPFFVFYNDVIPTDEHAFGMWYSKLLSIGHADDKWTFATQLPSNLLSIHRQAMAQSLTVVKDCRAMRLEQQKDYYYVAGPRRRSFSACGKSRNNSATLFLCPGKIRSGAISLSG